MYTEALKAFVESHRPAEIHWSVGQVAGFAKAAGLEVRSPGNRLGIDEAKEGQILVVGWGDLSTTKVQKKVRRPFVKWIETAEFERFHHSVLFGESKVKWEEVVEGNAVVYRPSFWRSGGTSFGVAPDPAKEILKVAGVESIVVPLPEPAFLLPAPSWITPNNSWADSWEIPGNDVLTCFRSEAATIVQPFIDQLQKLIK